MNDILVWILKVNISVDLKYTYFDISLMHVVTHICRSRVPNDENSLQFYKYFFQV